MTDAPLAPNLIGARVGAAVPSRCGAEPCCCTPFIPPALPSPAERPPIGGEWIHEIKHDGYRMMVRRDVSGVRVLTRNGKDWTRRFPTIVQAASGLKTRSCLIDGEAVGYTGHQIVCPS